VCGRCRCADVLTAARAGRCARRDRWRGRSGLRRVDAESSGECGTIAGRIESRSRRVRGRSTWCGSATSGIVFHVCAKTRGPMSLTPEERSLRARLAAHVSWARTEDRAARTARARARRWGASRSRSTRTAPSIRPNEHAGPSTPARRSTARWRCGPYEHDGYAGALQLLDTLRGTAEWRFSEAQAMQWHSTVATADRVGRLSRTPAETAQRR
jgi:hypothetical protein